MIFSPGPFDHDIEHVKIRPLHRYPRVQKERTQSTSEQGEEGKAKTAEVRHSGREGYLAVSDRSNMVYSPHIFPIEISTKLERK